jgi:hypothetical protein
MKNDYDMEWGNNAIFYHDDKIIETIDNGDGLY